MAAIIHDLRVELDRLKTRGIFRAVLNDLVMFPSGKEDMEPFSYFSVIYLRRNSWQASDVWGNVWTVSSLGIDVQSAILEAIV
jgi:hypothetical protein